MTVKAFTPNSLSESEARVTSCKSRRKGTERLGQVSGVPCRLCVLLVTDALQGSLWGFCQAPGPVQRVSSPLVSSDGDVACREGDSGEGTLRLVCEGSLRSAHGVSADKIVK